jgi:hypothetical protein
MKQRITVTFELEEPRPAPLFSAPSTVLFCAVREEEGRVASSSRRRRAKLLDVGRSPRGVRSRSREPRLRAPRSSRAFLSTQIAVNDSDANQHGREEGPSTGSARRL